MVSRPLRTGVLAALLAFALSCAGREPAPAPASPGSGDRDRLEAAIAELRFRLTSNPRDIRAHAALARLLVGAERPGAAIRHYEVVRDNGRLAGEDRVRLAALLRARARERLAAGDPDAHSDLDMALELDPGLAAATAGEVAEALFAAGRAALRRPDRAGRVEAAELLGRAAVLDPRDPRLAVLEPRGAAAGALGDAAAWLFDGGARRVSLELFEQYVEREGRRRDLLGRYLEAHRWWHGDQRRPRLRLLREMEEAGVDPCVLAYAPEDFGCGASISYRGADAAAAELLRERAARGGWRTSDPREAAGWVLASLRAWLAGATDSWLGELGRRVDVDAVAAAATPAARARASGMPIAMVATILRAAGRGPEAHAALDRALEEAPRLSPAERAVLLAEAAAQRRPAGVIEHVLAAGPATEEAWLIALRAARAAADTDREAALLEAAGPEVAARHLRAFADLGALVWRFPELATGAERLALARLWKIRAEPVVAGRARLVARWQRLAGGVGDPAAWSGLRATALGHADGRRLAADLGVGPVDALALAAIALYHAKEPAVAERLAREFADGAVFVGTRGPLVAELWLRLGDPARSRAWWAEVLEAAPRHPAFLFSAGVAAAAAGDTAAADVLFVHAAALSGDAGRTSLRAAEAYLDRGHALEAIAAGRRALELTAPGEDHEVLELLARAMLSLGRELDAHAALETLVSRHDERFADAGRARAHEIWGARRASGALGGPIWRGRRGAILARGDRAELARELALDPADARLVAAVGGGPALAVARGFDPDAGALVLGAPGEGSLAEETRAELLAELMLIGLAASPARARAALAHAAAELDRLGQGDVADDARREAASLLSRPAETRPRRSAAR